MSKIISYILLIMIYTIMMGSTITIALSDYQGICYNYSIVDGYILAEISGSAVGDAYVYASNKRDTVLIHQAVVASTAYNESYGYDDGFESTWVTLGDQQIEVVVSSVSEGSFGPRLTDPFSFYTHYDGSRPPTNNNIVLYALDVLWNIAAYYADLPLPSPWGLMAAMINGEEQPEVSLTIYDVSTGFIAICNTNPEMFGADWLWFVEKPIVQGYYGVDIYARSTVYIGHDTSWYGGGIWYEEYGNINVYFIGEVYVQVGNSGNDYE